MLSVFSEQIAGPATGSAVLQVPDFPGFRPRRPATERAFHKKEQKGNRCEKKKKGLVAVDLVYWLSKNMCIFPCSWCVIQDGIYLLYLNIKGLFIWWHVSIVGIHWVTAPTAELKGFIFHYSKQPFIIITSCFNLVYMVWCQLKCSCSFVIHWHILT